jgi:L-ribulose-5-phosphate 3-epimerase
MPRIAIMQGRLLPPEDGRHQCFPRERWREEFPSAAAAGFDAIEWIYDLYGADVNPLATDEGVAEMRSLSSHHGIAIASLVADYYMRYPFGSAAPTAFAKLTEHLRWLLGRCKLAGIGRVVLPFVDAARIENNAHRQRILLLMQSVTATVEKTGVEIRLETALDPAEFADLLAALPHPMVKVNYDSGNSSSLGYDYRQELAAYGPRIGSVHIKDRVRGGSTVPLGTGSADIPGVLARLAELSYSGDYVLEAARGVPGEEIAWSRANCIWLRSQLEQAALAPSGSAR